MFEGSSVGAIWASLKMNTAQFDSALAGMEIKMAETGKNLTKFLTLPILAVGVAAGKMYTDFELTMSRITGLVGLSTGEVNKMSDALLQLAPAVGQAPQDLAEALYFITSAGITDTAKAMDVLTVSAKAASAGLGSTKVVADAVTSVMNAYASSGMTATHATDVLTAAVRYGKMEASDLAPVIGRVVAVSSSMGISFDQVAGALASMSRVGFNAAEASTSLVSIMSGMLKPTTAGADALKSVGLSYEKLRDLCMQPGGLIAAIRLLNTSFNGNDEALATVIPNIRALRGVMNLLAQDGGTVDMVLQGVTNSTGMTDSAFQAYEQTNKALIDTALEGLKSSLISIGGVVMPMVASAIKSLGADIVKFADWWRELDDRHRKFIVTAALVVAAIGPVVSIISAVTSAVGLAGKALTFLAANPMALAIAAAVALAAGVIWLANNWTKVWTDMKNSSDPIIKGIVGLIEGIISAVRKIIDAIKDAIAWFNKLGNAGKQSNIYSPPTGAPNVAGFVPQHAMGGYFTTPHVALIAEQGPEWVVPQSRAAAFASQMGGNDDSLLRELTFQVRQLQQVVTTSSAGVVAAIRG